MYLHGSMAFTGSESFLTMANTLIHHNQGFTPLCTVDHLN
jgi:hypothetical protein